MNVGFQIHSTWLYEKKRDYRIPDMPGSKGCPISRSASYDYFTRNMKDIGFSWQRRPTDPVQTIDVHIQISPEYRLRAPYNTSHVYGTWGP